jgi:hypothetical protein
MCKLCDRDKNIRIITPEGVVVKNDRLAVLEKDDKAMERLRKRDVNVLGRMCKWTMIPGKKKAQDPADAILSVKEE